jgi:hypothetical protein
MITERYTEPMKRPTVLAQRNYRRARSEMQARRELKDKFAYIYETNLWGAEESQSGLGSGVDATRQVRAALEQVCADYSVKTLLDLPCGDVSWIHCANLPIREYIGGDIVPGIIERNRSRGDLRQLPYTTRFEVLDVTQDRLPCPDLFLCRDCLVHLSFENIRVALKNVLWSGACYLLTTTFTDHDFNEDIEDGDWRLLNLERPPFSLPPPLALFNEGCDEESGAFADKSVGLWDAAQLDRFAD